MSPENRESVHKCGHEFEFENFSSLCIFVFRRRKMD